MGVWEGGEGGGGGHRYVCVVAAGLTPPARKGELGAQCCGWQRAGRQALRRSAIYWKHRHVACFAMLMRVRLGHACCELSIKNECTSICQASRPCNLGACADVLSRGPGLIATCTYLRGLSSISHGAPLLQLTTPYISRRIFLIPG